MLCQLGISCLTATGLLATTAQAQSISTDGTTPTTLTGTCTTGSCTITDGSRLGSSTNLFHSFSTFNVETNATVIFDPLAGVTNIFSRVTGPNNSVINGTLQVNNDANLFLLNPNGILFGENAQLDIGGSFLASTADSLLFQDGTQFNAANPSASSALLTVSVPTGLQFGNSPQSIQVGNDNASSNPLYVGDGNTLALIGGDIVLQEASLSQPSNDYIGHIEIGSIGQNSQVTFDASSPQWDFDYSQTLAFQDISILQESSVDVSGDDAGSIHIQGANIEIDSSNILAQVSDAGNGNITLDASEHIHIDTSADALSSPSSNVSVIILPGATGDGKSQLNLNAPEIDLAAGAQINMLIAGDGQSGEVNIESSILRLTGESTTRPTTLSNSVIFANPNAPGTGSGGNLNIQTRSLDVQDGAQVAVRTDSLGSGGLLDITAEEVTVSGFGSRAPSLIVSASGLPPSRFTNFTQLPNGSGLSGDIIIDTARLTTTNGGQIVTGTNSNSAAGTLTIEASEQVTLDGEITGLGKSGLFANAIFGSGEGGDINVNTPLLSLSNGATINASNNNSARNRPSGSGAAGDINLTASVITLTDESIITADTISGDNGANINIQSEGLALRRGSDITASAQGSTTGGNISIDTDALIAFEDSDIRANSLLGPGGRVSIRASSILGTEYREQETTESDITATSALGPEFNGTVEIETPGVDPVDGIETLPEGLSAEDQVVAACEQLPNNTFVATGRGGVPSDASQLITGQSIWSDFRLTETLNRSSSTTSNKNAINNETITAQASTTETTIVEAVTWAFNNKGEVVLNRYSNTAAVAPQLSAQCLSEQTLS